MIRSWPITVEGCASEYAILDADLRILERLLPKSEAVRTIRGRGGLSRKYAETLLSELTSLNRDCLSLETEMSSSPSGIMRFATSEAATVQNVYKYVFDAVFGRDEQGG